MKTIPRPSIREISKESILDSFASRMRYALGRDEYTATDYDVFQAIALAVRDRIMERWFVTQDAYYRSDAKRVYYLSLEFLMGRALINNLLNLRASDAYAQALEEIGYKMADLEELEPDAGLGNGGLGRLAACFLDSAATLELPVYGYGIRYEYGIFGQQIVDGFQVEQPDNWLRLGNPWEIARPDTLFPVRFYGRTTISVDAKGKEHFDWVDTEDIFAMAYDTPVLGYGTNTVNTLRLWAAKSSKEFDLARFNAGDYVKAVEHKNQTENISKVLYPPDDVYAGKELRLKQQYFFVSATLQDVFRRFKKDPSRKLSDLPAKVAIQLNDTHPSIAIPELMRLLLDVEHLEWDEAWAITSKIFGYTNHTILAEALESWSLDLIGRLLPRHLQIIQEIDRRFRARVRMLHPGDEPRVARMAIVDDAAGSVRMAHLAIVGSHSVNGVARLHSDILKASTFREFHEMYPGRFNNKTNGITPRRWLLKANHGLAGLITDAIGDGWVTDLRELEKLRPLADDAAFREKWLVVKRANKERLCRWLRRNHDMTFDSMTMLDTQVKRIHEYKRQLLNALHTLALYHRVRDGEEIEPRTVLFAGKAAPSYVMAKLIIRLINAIAQFVAADRRVSSRLQVGFIPNYNVSSAERIFPATDLSEQISTAGTEASGTGNMKASLNGAVIIGTLDGANIEIKDEVGENNIFIFGHTDEQIASMRNRGYDARSFIERSPVLQRVIRTIDEDLPGSQQGLFDPIVSMLVTSDRYFHCADFDLYVARQRDVETVFRDRDEWARRSIANTAGAGFFSSDRTIREYASEIWKATPVVPAE